MARLQDPDEESDALSVERIGRYGLSQLQRLIAATLRALHVDEVPEVRQDWESEQSVEVEAEGEQQVPADVSAELVPMIDSDLVESTRHDLHMALQAHMNALGGPYLVTDWYAVIDCVNEDDERVLNFVVSSGISAWRLRGMAYYGNGILERYTS